MQDLKIVNGKLNGVSVFNEFNNLLIAYYVHDNLKLLYQSKFNLITYIIV